MTIRSVLYTVYGMASSRVCASLDAGAYFGNYIQDLGVVDVAWCGGGPSVAVEMWSLEKMEMWGGV